MTTCPYCHIPIPDPAMRFCGQCGAKLNEPADASPDAANGEAGEPHPELRTKDDVRREKEERSRRTTAKVILVLWLVLPITFGCVAAANGASFWVGFIIGALANGVIGFLLHPFGI
jgi:hypothetical protein